MTCYFPLQAFKGKSQDADKIKITFKRSESWRGVEFALPCGQCVGCRLERSRQWAVRCMHEASLYDKNCFLTLTYSDEFLPADGSLHLEHFQLFMKRLRKVYGPGIRFFHCGEYGDKFKRPHYHALLFNFDFPDLKYFKGSEGKELYTSESLSDLWPYGHSLRGGVTFESAGYVARYCMKKLTGDRKVEYLGRAPEYTTMSRGSKKLGTGGIGKGWYDRFKTDVYPLDRVVVRGRDTRPPRFYDKLFFREDRSTFEQLKIKREREGGNHFVSDVLSDGRSVIVSDSSLSRLAIKEVVKQAEVSQLIRPLEAVI